MQNTEIPLTCDPIDDRITISIPRSAKDKISQLKERRVNGKRVRIAEVLRRGVLKALEDLESRLNSLESA